jgi:hypothetical protein
MDKNTIKKYAVWARNELIARVSQKAEQYEILATADPKADAVRGVLLTKDEKEQRAKLIGKVKEKGIDQVMEEVAYTWFNRFSALRFMEANNYLPTRVRVFTDESGAFKPQILDESIHMDLKGLDMEKVYALKEANDNDTLFKYLIITQCNALSEVLPGMFQKISDYTELLFPDNLLREGSVVEQMVTTIPEDNWDISKGGQIEILGWLYQYYISEKHDAVVDPLHGKVVKKEEVPAATALFTTDWVVRYIIDNSVGRYWIERNPNSNLKNELEYFVTPKDGEISTVYEKITPEQLTVFDPSMGSAHFGVYAFEVLEKIYTEYGYTEREAAASIVQNNLFGLDIDDRSAQIAYFAIMMKAMQYDKRFLRRGIQPHFYSIKESNDIDSFTVDYFANGNAKLKKDIQSIIDDFKDAKEYGSILQISPVDYDALFARFDEIKSGTDINIYTRFALEQLLPIVEVAKVLSGKYAVVATNPPYMNKYDANLKDFVNNTYKDYSGDLFSVFMYRNFSFCKHNGYSGFMTPFVWMFIKSYENLRNYIISNKAITTLIQFEYSAYEEATVPICSFVLKNRNANEDVEPGIYFKLSAFTGGMETQRRKTLEAIQNKNCGYLYETCQNDFPKIPGSPIGYWLSQSMFRVFEKGVQLNTVASPKQGLATTDNNRFVRFWHEVDIHNIGFGMTSEQAKNSGLKWFPLNKGGEFRKWYGNNDCVVNYQNDGAEIKANVLKKYTYLKTPDFVVKNQGYYFKENGTWGAISSSKISVRYSPAGFVISNAGMAIYSPDKLKYIIAYMNSNSVMTTLLPAINQTINFNAGDLERLPFIYDKKKENQIVELTNKCIELSKMDWDSRETSWDFRKNPLLSYDTKLIKEAFLDWSRECEKRFKSLKSAEEEINRLFIDINGLNQDLDPEENESDVTVHKANLQQDIRDFISYAVGCMFGRYSLDQEGLVYAGGEFDDSSYVRFKADRDGIIPICDDDYFDDDITGLFIKYVETVYGPATLEENLKFIADALGGNGSPREVIRNYFINDFYLDHCKTYQKRPIYWLFDSGKKNGFKCLIYMHRYQPDTIARIRTDYVHEQQARYRTACEGLERQLIDASSSERVKINKRLSKLKDQAEETRKYEEKIHHLADRMLSIDLDDGVKQNYDNFKDVLKKIR